MRTITLEGPALNALGTGLMASLLAQVRHADGEPLLFTGSGGAFSAGLDLREVHGADLDAMRHFHGLLEDLVAAIYAYPGPTAAAIDGHAIAGGAIVALVCDRRVVTTRPEVRMGLNEVALGLRFPPRLLAMVRRCLPPRHQVEVLLGADLYDPAGAVRVGLADALADDPVADATAWLARVGRHPADAYAATKAVLRPPVGLTEAERAAFEAEILPGWVAPAIKRRIAAFLSR